MATATTEPTRLRALMTVEGHERLCALLGAVTIAFSSILVRLSHASPSTAAIFRCVYALPLLGLLAWREDRRNGSRSWRERRAGLGAGVFFAADLLLWHHSIGDVGAGLATVLANIQVVLVPLVAWALLAERPAATVLGALVHAASITVRAAAVDAVPWSNMYEFASVAGLVGVVAYIALLWKAPQIRHLGGFILLPVILMMFLA
ncbi:MAG: hypothetical protein DLM64_05920, partial [Solirubrobacterales bacterium]